MGMSSTFISFFLLLFSLSFPPFSFHFFYSPVWLCFILSWRERSHFSSTIIILWSHKTKWIGCESEKSVLVVHSSRLELLVHERHDDDVGQGRLTYLHRPKYISKLYEAQNDFTTMKLYCRVKIRQRHTRTHSHKTKKFPADDEEKLGARERADEEPCSSYSSTR